MKYEEEQIAKLLAYKKKKKGYRMPKTQRPQCDYFCKDGHRCNARVVMSHKNKVLTGQCIRHSPLAALEAEAE